MTRSGKKSPWKVWPRMVNWLPGSTAASGSRWIPCATNKASIRYGIAEPRPGSYGKGERDGKVGDDEAGCHDEAGAMAGLVTGGRACGGRLTVTMADLGLQPASNAFITSMEAAHDEKRYPLRAKVCESCKLVQVDYDVAPQELFGHYVYFSSYSDDWLAHAKDYCTMARRRFGLDAGSLVVELASNDGYLLKNFIDMGVPVLGIDPSDTVAAAAEKIGVPTMVEFFGASLAKRLAGSGRQADLIIG